MVDDSRTRAMVAAATSSGGRDGRGDASGADCDHSDPQFEAMTARLLRREALRRAAKELNTTFGPGLESVLASISAEVTADAASRVTTARAAVAAAIPTLPGSSLPGPALSEHGRDGK